VPSPGARSWRAAALGWLLVSAAALLTATPASADFYTPPQPLPPGLPGDIIRAEPMTAYVAPGIPYPAHAWRILYRSTTATGQPVAVSGVVLVPTAPYPGPRPLIGYAVGTQGLASRCAASRQLAAGTEYEAVGIRPVLEQGWAIALTDYPGLGTPGGDPYIVGQALGRAVLDSMRAARRLPADGLTPNGPLALWGYSEGGLGSSAAAELQPSYAPALRLSAVTAGGIPTDLERAIQFVDGTPLWWLSLYAAIGYNAAYPELDLSRYLNAQGRHWVGLLGNTCVEDASALGAAAPSHHVSDYLTQAMFARADWRARMDENRLGSVAPASPTLIQEAQNDEAVPFAPVRTLYGDWCSLGANVHLSEVPGEHFTGAASAVQPAIAFIAARFDHVPLLRAADCNSQLALKPPLTLQVLPLGRRLPQRRGASFAVSLTATAGTVRNVDVTLRAGRRLVARRTGFTVRRRTRVVLRLLVPTRSGQLLVLRARGRGLSGRWVAAAPVTVRVGAPTAPAGAGDPGGYYMFRSFDAGAPFTSAQQQACTDHYGSARGAGASDLNAGLFAFTTSASTGQVENQKASYLGPGIACTAPVSSPNPSQTDPDLLEIFGVIWPPPSTLAGLSTFDAPCSPSPALTQPGVLLVNCRGSFGPGAGGRVIGGFATSNSVSNPHNAVPGAPTGSIWTTYVVAKHGTRLPPPPGGTPPATPAPSPGLDFYVFRASTGAVAAGSPDCPSSPTAPIVAARRSDLYATAPRLSDGRLPEQVAGSPSGALTVCFTSAGSGRSAAVARIELSTAGHDLSLDLSGDCAEYATPAGATLRQQACNLRVMQSAAQMSSGIKGGLLTSNGLVRAGDPIAAADSPVCTLALFSSAA
jgi:hypothetical protein